MVGDNLYFISRTYKYYYEEMPDMRILPVFNDSVVDEVKNVECTDIIYFNNSNASNIKDSNLYTFLSSGWIKLPFSSKNSDFFSAIW